MDVIRCTGIASLALILSACAAPRWENLKNPAADLQADIAACDHEAERVAKLDQLAHRLAFQGDCAGCQTHTPNRQMQTDMGAFAVKKRCMASRGWRQAS